MNIKIGISGKTATGKTTIAKAISKHFGYPIVSFGGVLIKYSKENKLPYDKSSLQQLGQKLINNLGQVKFMDWVIEFSKDIQWDKSVIVEGFRHVEIYKHFANTFTHTILIYCSCNQEEQIERIMKRNKISRNKAVNIICHTTEQNVEGLKLYTDYLFDSKSDLDSLINYLDTLI